jgi:hypothetical protein
MPAPRLGLPPKTKCCEKRRCGVRVAVMKEGSSLALVGMSVAGVVLLRRHPSQMELALILPDPSTP